MPEETGLPFASRHAGRMHACGHDAHVAMLTGAARLLAQDRASLPGDVVFMFQPGEEAFGGAEVMLREGMPEVDAAFALHVAPLIPTGMIGTKAGAIMASFDDFVIEVRGRGGHASMPHDCIDPIPVASEIVQAMQSFVTRRVPATDPGVVTFAQIHAGTTNNVIADSVRLTGTMRALSDRTRAMMRRRAAAHRRGHRANARSRGTHRDRLRLSRRRERRRLRSLRPRGRLRSPRRTRRPGHAPARDGRRGFRLRPPTCPGRDGAARRATAGHEGPGPCHSSQMMLDEEAMPIGVALHATIASRFLARPSESGLSGPRRARTPRPCPGPIRAFRLAPLPDRALAQVPSHQEHRT